MPLRYASFFTASPGVLLFATSLLAAGCGGDDGAPPLVDDDGSASTGTVSVGSTTTTTGINPSADESSSSGFVPLCNPGELRCSPDGDAIEICAGTGLSWDVESTCGSSSACQPCDDDTCTAPMCVGPCQLTENDPSSAGCAFVVNRQLHPFDEAADGLVITNPNTELTARIQIFEVPEGLLEEQQFGDDIELLPGTSTTIELLTDFVPGLSSNLRTGGIFRVYSDVPVISYQHAPLRANRGNESALLLPDAVLGQDYVVVSYTSLNGGFRGVSYFELVALEDNTRVEWTPPVDTAGTGLPIDPVAAGDTGALILNRYETVRIVPSQLGLPKEDFNAQYETLDISGTVIASDKPVWVTGGNRYSRVPLDEPGQGGSGDQLLEVMFPLRHWGQSYVLPGAIERPYEADAPLPEWQDFVEESHYRIYAGRANTTVMSDPADPAFPLTLENVGDFVDIETAPGVSLSLSGDGPFMPVQYIRSKNPVSPNAIEGPPQTGYGDPAMVQMVPTEQYLSRYVFATGVDFFYNFVQISRATSDVEVRVIADEGGAITRVCNEPDCDYGFVPVGADFEVAIVPLLEGTFTAESDTPFGIIQTGSTRSVGNDEDGNPLDTSCEAATAENPFCISTYAYPGGLKAETIFVP